METKVDQFFRIWPLTLFALIFAPYFFFFWIPHRILTGTDWAYSFDIGDLRFVGWLPIVMGLVVFGWCVLSFAFFGNGTPSPLIPPKRLVAKGLYRFVRNPMYLGWLLVLAGEVILFQSIPLAKYFWGTFAFFYVFILLFEEPSLSHKFGESYEQYRRSVRRWIPRLKPYHPANP